MSQITRKIEINDGNGNVLEPFFDFWFEQGLPKHKDTIKNPLKDNKSYQRSVKNLRRLIMGTLFNDSFLSNSEKYHNKKFSLEEFELSVRRYARSFSPGFKTKKTKKPISLGLFLLPDLGSSLFLFYFENEPRPPIRDLYPSLTNALIKIYCEKVLGGAYFEPSLKEMEQFMLASMRLHNFLKKHGHLLSPYIDINDHEYKVVLLIDAIREDIEWRKGPLSVGFLCSDITFHQRLPAYLRNQGVLGQSNQDFMMGL